MPETKAHCLCDSITNELTSDIVLGAVYIQFIYGNYCFIRVIIMFVELNVVLFKKLPYFNWLHPILNCNDN